MRSEEIKCYENQGLIRHRAVDMHLVKTLVASAENKAKATKMLRVEDGTAVLIFLGIGGFILVFLIYAKDLPGPERLADITFSQPTEIYDRTGKILLYEIFGEEKRKWRSRFLFVSVRDACL